MSYLHSPQIIFSGDFQADVSTVNNDIRHYDNNTFEPRFQQPGDGKILNGWWNPTGGSAFRFVNCKVTQANYPDGSSATASTQDPVIGQWVAGPGDQSSGKMVDLDPQMQMTSELWGVKIRLYTAENVLILEGGLTPVGFRDLQQRQVAQSSRNGQALGGTWTSVLSNLQWGEMAGQSKVLKELKAQTQEGMLSVQLSAFGYYYAHNDGRFSMGRILGTIAPYFTGEPKRFAPARRLVGAAANKLTAGFGFSNCLYQENSKRLTIDLGESFPITDPFGTVQDVGTLQVAVSKNVSVTIDPKNPTEINAGDCEIIGEVNYKSSDWLMNTSGIVSLDVPTPAVPLIPDHPILLVTNGSSSGKYLVLASETTNGLAVRADQNVQRLYPGDSAAVDVYAYQWGKPLANATIKLDLAAPSKSGGGPSTDPDPPQAPIPYSNIPASAIGFPSPVTTDSNGKVTITVKGKDPGNPRKYIDGQFYQILYHLNGLPRSEQYFNDAILTLVFDQYTAPANPTWSDIQPILTQFGNLYPLMSKHIVDLSDRDSVIRNRKILLFAFSREVEDTLYMPVTRDLSPEKRGTIIKWLQSVSGEEEPLTAIAAASTPAPLQPTEEDLKRPPAMVMNKIQYQAMTEGEGGKIDALKGARGSFSLT